MNTRAALTLSIAVLAAINPESVSAEGDCTLKCLNDGVCKIGPARLSKYLPKGEDSLPFFVTEMNGMHCECPEGFTGLTCDRPYQSCGDGSNMNMCFHGGVCTEGGEDEFGNPQHYCNCKNAAHNGVPYVGKYCEHEKTNQCDKKGDYFCVNGGKCKSDFEKELFPCECSPEFTGHHCEFSVDKVPQCLLQCENGGGCQLGLKSYSQAERVSDAPFLVEQIHFQHCVCPSGHTGLKCEVETNECGPFPCYHGAQCLTDGDHHHCDCSTAKAGGKSYAGRYCEHPASEFCRKSDGESAYHFCANDGKCKAKAIDGCECPKGYSGPKCEYTHNKVPPCNLQCENGGQCRKGIKTDPLVDFKDMDLMPYAHRGFEYCECHAGFVGVTCEAKVDTCGEEGKHICLHGSVCENIGGKWGCNCAHAGNLTHMYAGEHCQHPATDNCAPDATSPHSFFCANGGRCRPRRGKGDKHEGCICPEGFSGEHCEITSNSYDNTKIPSGTTNNNNDDGDKANGGNTSGNNEKGGATGKTNGEENISAPNSGTASGITGQQEHSGSSNTALFIAAGFTFLVGAVLLLAVYVRRKKIANSDPFEMNVDDVLTTTTFPSHRYSDKPSYTRSGHLEVIEEGELKTVELS